MTTTINADNVTGGAIVTGDSSGVLALQAAGSTQVTINGSGVVLANPLPVASGGTGATSLSGITAGSATNLAGGSNGTIPYQSASGTTQMLAVGTSGQVLQTNGAGAPSWVTPSAGAWSFISTTTASNAGSIDITSGIDSTYGMYMIYIEYIYCTSNDQNIYLKYYLNGSLISSNYYSTVLSGRVNATTTSVAGNSNGGQISLTGSLSPMQNTLASSLKGTINIFNPSTTTQGYKEINWQIQAPEYSSAANYGEMAWMQGWGQTIYANNQALTGIRLTSGSGNVYAKLHLYGMKVS